LVFIADVQEAKGLKADAAITQIVAGEVVNPCIELEDDSELVGNDFFNNM